MTSFIRNYGEVKGQLSAFMKRIEFMPTLVYRQFVWDVFKRILRETPQYSGRAVANWNLSIGSPNFHFDPALGDEDIDLVGPNAWAKRRPIHEKGDEYPWQRVARDRARPIKEQIQQRSKVFISNGTMGDEKFGQGYVAYLQQFQNAGSGWQNRLRAVNRPYEAVADSVRIVGEQYIRKGWNVPLVGFGHTT